MSEESETSTSTEEQHEPVVDEKKSGWIRLALIVGAALFFGLEFGFIATLGVVGAIILIITIHEGGHFLAAKATGMKATEFFLGFGPKLWSIKRGETEYGIKAIPAGAYVRIIGMHNLEEVDPDDESRTYRQQTYWKRMVVVLAGVATHFIGAFLILALLFMVVGRPVANETPVIGTVTEGLPAAKGGLKEGDVIKKIDGHVPANWDDISTYVEPKAGEPVIFTVERGGKTLDIRVVPGAANKVAADDSYVVEEKGAKGFVGIAPSHRIVHDSLPTGVSKAAGETVHLTWAVVKIAPVSIAGMVEKVFSGERPAADERLSSPVGIVRVADQAANEGWREVLSLLVLFNISLGVFNLLPLHPFDGGHAAVATYERIRSRKGRRHHVDISRLMPATYAVVAALILLSVLALYYDVVDPIDNPFG